MKTIVLYLVDHEGFLADIEHLGDVEVKLTFSLSLLTDVAKLLPVQANKRLDARVQLESRAAEHVDAILDLLLVFVFLLFAFLLELFLKLSVLILVDFSFFNS